MKRFVLARRASIAGVFGNLFLLIIKFMVAFISNSQAMIADAFNSAGDIFSSLMTFIGNQISSKPRDDVHNLGYGKAEYIFSIFIAISMFYVGIKLFYNAAKSLFIPVSYNFSIWLIVVCIVTIIVKICLFLYTRMISLKVNNLLIKANAIDHRNDCILTFCNLIAVLCAYKGWFFVDSFVGIFISSWIIISAVKIFLEGYYVLMDRSIDEETRKKIIDIVKAHKEVLRVNHVNATPVGYQFQVNLTIFVDGDMSTFASHEVANKIEKELVKLDFISLAVIHVNPMKIEKNK